MGSGIHRAAGWKVYRVSVPGPNAWQFDPHLARPLPMSACLCTGTLPESYSALEALLTFDAHGNNLTGEADAQ